MSTSVNDGGEEGGVEAGAKASEPVQKKRKVATDAHPGEWTENYGELLHFFEENGHINVPAEHSTVLGPWVQEQINNFSALSQEQAMHLEALNFPVPGQTYQPRAFSRCSAKECGQYAAFDDHCHAHYSATNASGAIYTMLPLLLKAKANPGQSKKPRTASTHAKKPDFPLVGLKKRRNGIYDIDNKDSKVKDITREEVIGRLDAYVEKLSKSPCHNSNNKQKATTCNCMRFLEDQPFVRQSVSHALMDYFDLATLQRKHYAVERMRYSEMGKEIKHSQNDGPRRVFFLPLSYDYFDQQCVPVSADEEEDGGDNSADKQEVIGKALKHRICSHAFYHLHNIGWQLRQTLTKYAAGDISAARHGCSGKKNRGTKYTEAYESLRAKLNRLTEEYRGYADINGDITLPLEISKHKTFEQWCGERGWRLTKSNAVSGQYNALDNCDTMPGYYKTEEEAIANGGDASNVAKLVFSWTSFNRLWNEEFGHLKTEARVGKGKFGGNYCTETKRYYPRSGAQAREITPDWR